MIQPVSQVLGIDLSRKGIKAGLSISNYIDRTSDYENKLGYCGGFFFTLDINNFLSVQPELLFSLKGGRTELTFTGEESPDSLGTYWWNENLYYLEVPLLVKLSIAQSKPLNAFLLCGPAVGIKLKAKYKIDESSIVADGDLADVSSMDYSMIFGAGLEIKIAQKVVSLDGRYVMGLTPCFQEGDDKNRVISVMVGYSF
jgi:hypothetical protein